MSILFPGGYRAIGVVVFSRWTPVCKAERLDLEAFFRLMGKITYPEIRITIAALLLVWCT